jgi:integrase/recombinase XerD
MSFDLCVTCSLFFYNLKITRTWKKTLSPQAVAALEKANQYLSVGHYSPLTIRNYLEELRFIFVYYPDVDPLNFTEAMIIQYLLYLSKTLGCSRVKCKMAAQAIAFFMRHVAKRPYAIPTVIYPRPENKLPPVMLPEEIMKLIDGVQNIKHRTILMLLYSTGMRVSEIANCKIADIDSANMRIKVVQGKGAKDRYTIMSQQVLMELRAYYLIYKPKEYLFNGYRLGKRYSVRTIQHIMQKALIKVGLESKRYTIHSIRHSFATHLLDNGTDLHTIKELLGHNNLQTIMRYMHLTSRRTEGIFNPYDALLLAKDNNIIKQNLK